MENEYTVRQFLEDSGADFDLELLTEVDTGPIGITVPDVHRPAFALTGFMANYLHNRIQLLGETEILFLRSLTGAEQREAFARLFSERLCCMIVTKGLDLPPDLLPMAEERGVPVLRTSMSTTPFIHSLTSHLESVFAPQTTVHGSLVDVYGVGLFFTGRSGIGKSEIVLDLVERGHRLVADDVVEIIRQGDVLMGRGKEHLLHFMEIRGLGIINVMDLFGIRAVRIQKRIEVVVHLEDWDPNKDWDRVGLEEQRHEILGVNVRQVTIPIYPGKNITVISETIALNHMLKVYGIDAAKRLDQTLMDMIESDRKTRRYLKHDTE
ncbi:MAG: HPr(Ser) kinase/phosphatase [Candidatus Krumholzibacteriota bacterium]|nr:HPr(Ser) kinase/phosphatase [Candidatus Krumholzibacteriota bacterium]